MPFTIVRQDITKMDVDIIVNATNTSLSGVGGVCRAIFEVAGYQQMQEAYQRLSYPKQGAVKVATDTIWAFLDDHDLDIYLAVFEQEAISIGEKLKGEVASYIHANYVQDSVDRRRLGRHVLVMEDDVKTYIQTPVESLEELVENLDEPFSETLLRLIDAKGKTDVEVYKKANLDRRLFSKIRGNKGYTPSKRTVIAFAIGLELSLDETNDLLKRAGFALSRSQISDIIVEYFILHHKYNIYEINEVLFYYGQPLLGGVWAKE